MNTIYNSILTIDEQLLLFINNLHTSIGDVLMWHFSEKLFWLPLYVILLVILIKSVGLKKSIVVVSLLILLIFITDQIGASVIRPLVCRLRPSSPLNPISELLYFVNDSRGGDFGFPSCHAANTFAVTTFLTCVLKSNWIKYILFSWAFVVSCSRIYLGFHYPTDIIAGAFLGISLGLIFYFIFKFVLNLKFFRASFGTTTLNR